MLNLEKILGEILVCHIGGGIQIQPVHGQKMIDPPMTDQDHTYNCFKVKIQHACGQKIIDSTALSMTDQDLPRIFLKLRFNMDMVTRWLTPKYDRPETHLEFF